MRNSRWVMVLMMGLALWAVPAAWADPITFSLLPAANQFGSPGSAISWNYQIINNTLADFQTLGVSAGVFVGGTADASPFDFPFVLAGDTVTGPLFSFLAGPTPSFNSSVFIIDTDTAGPLTAAYSVTISAVPEPSTLLLLATGLVPLALRKRPAARRRA